MSQVPWQQAGTAAFGVCRERQGQLDLRTLYGCLRFLWRSARAGVVFASRYELRVDVSVYPCVWTAVTYVTRGTSQA